MTDTDQIGFGWRPQFDDRSRAYPIRTLLPGTPLRSYTWACPTHLDQGPTGTCVGHAWAHEAIGRPVTAHIAPTFPFDVYHRAQQIDEWPGAEPDYEGTSVLAGAKAMVELGYQRGYRWAFTLDDILRTLAYRGPVIMGTDWYEGMMRPNGEGYIEPKGRIVGGHAYLLKSVSVARRRVMVHNSWGTGWGQLGDAYLTWDDLDLLRAGAEACVPVDRIKPRTGAA